MSLPDVIERATARPATILRMDGQIGTLRAGSMADASILELAEGAFTLYDGSGANVTAGKLLKPVAAVCSGALIPARSDLVRSSATWLKR